MSASTERDELWLREAFELSGKAGRARNRPFGAVLVSASDERLAVGQNTAYSERDPTGHAELNLLRRVGQRVPPEVMEKATLYASGEPCPMCAAALIWACVPRVVYGLSAPRLYELDDDPDPTRLLLRLTELVASSNRRVEVIGPMLEDEAAAAWARFRPVRL